MAYFSNYSYAQVLKDINAEASIDYPLWTEIITTQPEGYVVEDNGDVNISTAEGLAWLISTVNGLNSCTSDNFDGCAVSLINDINLKRLKQNVFYLSVIVPIVL